MRVREDRWFLHFRLLGGCPKIFIPLISAPFGLGVWGLVLEEEMWLEVFSSLKVSVTYRMFLIVE